MIALHLAPVGESLLVLSRTTSLSKFGSGCEIAAYCYHYPAELNGKQSYLIAEVRHSVAGHARRLTNRHPLCGQVYVCGDARCLGFGELIFAAALKSGLDTGATQFHLLVSSKNERARRLYAKYGFVDSDDLSDDATHDTVMVCTDLELGTILTRLKDRLAAIRAEPSKRVRVPTTVFDPADNMNDKSRRLAVREPLEAHVNMQPLSEEHAVCKRKRRGGNNWGSGKSSKRNKKATVVEASVGEAAVAQAEGLITRRADQWVECGQYVAAVFEDDDGIQQISYGLCVAMERRPLKGTPVKPRRVTETQGAVLNDNEVWLRCRWMRVAKHGNYRFNPTSDDEQFFEASSFLAQVSMVRMGPTCWKLDPEDRRDMGVIMTARRYLMQSK